MSEHAVAQSQAQCFFFDAASSNWKPLAEGLVNLYIYHHPGNKSYRVIGMNAQQQAVINSSLFPEVKYSHSNNVFHTWTDAQYAYGIHFASEDLAKKFSSDFGNCVSDLKGGAQPVAPAVPAAAATAPSVDAPAKPAAAATGGGGGGGPALSLADQIAAKKLKKAEERPVAEAAPAAPAGGGGGGGGNLMGELANALTKRRTTTAVGAPAGGAAPAAPGAPAAEPEKVAAAPKAAPKESPAAPKDIAGANKRKSVLKKGVAPAKVSPPAPSSAPGAIVSPRNDVGAAVVVVNEGGAGGGGGISVEGMREELERFKSELAASMREELALFKAELLAEIMGALGAAQSAAGEEGYYEEEAQ